MEASDGSSMRSNAQHEGLEDSAYNNVELNHSPSSQTEDEEKLPAALSSKVAYSKKDETPEKSTTNHAAQFPEGGFDAWLNYYVSGPLSQYSPSTVGWIVSIEIFMMLFMSPWVGLWYDNFGPQSLLLVGTFLHVFGLMMTSLCKEYYQFLLAQSICSAIGASMIFGPGMTCTHSWFFKKRGMAVGIATAGSSLGGVIFPIIVSRMIPEAGFPWAMRTCAFIILGLMVFANFAVKSRLPPVRRKFELMAFVRPLKEPPFLFLTVATFMYYYGLFIPLTFIVSDAVEHGMSLGLAEYLVSILNAGSIFGRTLPGIIGDKVGRFNTMIVFSLMTTILILAMWIPAESNAVFITFAPLFGFTTGAAIGLTPALVATISPIPQMGTRMGTLMGLASFATLTGTPIGGALVSRDHGDFKYTGAFGGVSCAIGAVFYIACRVKIAGWSLKKKV